MAQEPALVPCPAATVFSDPFFDNLPDYREGAWQGPGHGRTDTRRILSPSGGIEIQRHRPEKAEYPISMSFPALSVLNGGTMRICLSDRP